MIRLAKTTKRKELVLWFVAGVAVAIIISAGATPAGAAQRIRWDIANTNFTTTPLTVSAGGIASALANDGSLITLTGSGTFLTSPGRFSAVALGGGGTWKTFDAAGGSTGSGTYKVLLGPASFEEAPGTRIPTIDLIGNAQDTRAGLMVVEIRYDDGSRGILTLSCHLPGTAPPETPESVFEGITATKGFVDYWKVVPPVPGVNGNRTSFHVLGAR
jgi:hypothetical protein